MDTDRLLGLFIAQPLLALVPAAAFAFMYACRRRSVVIAATAIAWLVYVPYELAMKLRILCTGECNIRVDLLLLYPILAVLSVMGIVAYARGARRQPRD